MAAAACMIQDHGKINSGRIQDHGREEDPFKWPVWLVKGLSCVSLWVANHLKMMATGESPHVRVDFSVIVALSSFCYLGVAYCYWLQVCPLTSLMFSLVTITSLFSDSLCPSSKFWCCLDRSLATIGGKFHPSTLSSTKYVIYANRIGGLDHSKTKLDSLVRQMPKTDHVHPYVAGSLSNSPHELCDHVIARSAILDEYQD